MRDVDDLLQEISIKTLAGFETIEDQTKVQSWLFQIANRTIIDLSLTWDMSGPCNMALVRF